MHAQLAGDYGQIEWYDALRLEPEQAAMLREAKRHFDQGGETHRCGPGRDCYETLCSAKPIEV